MPEIPAGIKRPKFRLRTDLGRDLPDLQEGEKLEQFMRRGDAFRITGTGEGPPPYGHEYYIFCMGIYKVNATFSCFWDGHHREYNISGPRQVCWVQSRFRLGFRELRIEKSRFGLRRWVIVEISWLPPFEVPFQPGRFMEY